METQAQATAVSGQHADAPGVSRVCDIVPGSRVAHGSRINEASLDDVEQLALAWIRFASWGDADRMPGEPWGRQGNQFLYQADAPDVVLTGTDGKRVSLRDAAVNMVNTVLPESYVPAQTREDRPNSTKVQLTGAALEALGVGVHQQQSR